MSTTRLQRLVCFALKEEAAPFQQWAAAHPGIQLLLTGIGARNARRRFQQALSHHAPDLVFTCGFAGGLHPELTHGAIVYAMDDNFPWKTTGDPSLFQPARFHCSSRMIPTAAEKRQLRASTGADAVEMESGIIRELSRAARIPSATIRVISDTAQEDLPLDFNQFMTTADKLSLPRLALATIRSPKKIGPLLKLQRHSRLAAQELARALIQIIED